MPPNPAASVDRAVMRVAHGNGDPAGCGAGGAVVAEGRGDREGDAACAAIAWWEFAGAAEAIAAVPVMAAVAAMARRAPQAPRRTQVMAEGYGDGVRRGGRMVR
jgi:hypothetical protein